VTGPRRQEAGFRSVGPKEAVCGSGGAGRSGWVRVAVYSGVTDTTITGVWNSIFPVYLNSRSGCVHIPSFKPLVQLEKAGSHDHERPAQGAHLVPPNALGAPA
jgi:hypothetical protein